MSMLSINFGSQSKNKAYLCQTGRFIKECLSFLKKEHN